MKVAYRERYSTEPVSVDGDGKTLDAIFSTSYSTMPGESLLLSALALQGVIEIVRAEVEPAPVPRKSSWALSLQFQDASSGGGYGHSLLKWNAFHFLKRLGSPGPRYEQGWYHGRADVVCEGLQIAVECGSTAPLHVARCLAVRDAREFWLFPFPGRDGRHYGYRFRRGERFSQEVMDNTNWSMELAGLFAQEAS